MDNPGMYAQGSGVSARVLIVEDEATQRRILEATVARSGFLVESVSAGQACLDRIADLQQPPIDVVLLDLVMPGMDGIEVLENLRSEGQMLPVILLTARSSITTVVEAMRAGASDFIVKPASTERLTTALSAALDRTEMVGEIAGLGGKLSASVAASVDERGFDGLIGKSLAMQRSKNLARKAANSSIPVLIEGESGVGKEVFARAIHQAGKRRDHDFVAVNCGAIPENLVESILFGHEKGAFTGATEKRIGVFEEADGGTLFLDEVGELPADMQVKLLRALQEKEIQPVGSNQSVKVDIRVISATNRDLADAVAQGAFREDLYYRLNVFPVRLPPLRDRLDDVPLLANHFITQIARAEHLPRKRLSTDALELLSGYIWPGNIRQLQNALFRAVVLADGELLDVADFPHVHGASRPVGTVAGAIGAAAIGGFAPGPRGKHVQIEDDDGEIRSLKSMEAEIIRTAILHYDGRMAEVARRLKIGRSTLYRKVTAYGLEEIAGIKSEEAGEGTHDDVYEADAAAS